LPSGELSVHREVHIFEFKYNETNLITALQSKRRKLKGQKKSKSKVAK